MYTASYLQMQTFWFELCRCPFLDPNSSYVFPVSDNLLKKMVLADWEFSWFSQFLQANIKIILEIGHDLLTLNSFEAVIYHSA